MDLSAKKSNHISRLIQAAEAILEDIGTIKAMCLEAQALGYVSGGSNALQDGDFVGSNQFLDAAQYNQIVALMAAFDTYMLTPRTESWSGGMTSYSILYQAQS